MDHAQLFPFLPLQARVTLIWIALLKTIHQLVVPMYCFQTDHNLPSALPMYFQEQMFQGLFKFAHLKPLACLPTHANLHLDLISVVEI